MSGRVVHFEIPFDDGDRARAFYQNAFHWDIMSLPEMGYSLVSTGPMTQDTGPSEPGYIGGGMLQRQQFFQGPVLTVDVDDIEAALTKIENLGGKTVRPRQEVGEMGFAAYFTDPEGNLMGLWESTPQPASQGS
jgi:predicted enzyme related to lactoylglutathione lyase